jgi:hypothetical protein
MPKDVSRLSCALPEPLHTCTVSLSSVVSIQWNRPGQILGPSESPRSALRPCRIALRSSTATDAEDKFSPSSGATRMAESGGIAVLIKLSYTSDEGEEASVSKTSSVIAVNTGSRVNDGRGCVSHGQQYEVDRGWLTSSVGRPDMQDCVDKLLCAAGIQDRTVNPDDSAR